MLILPIKKEWFDMIASGEKKEEYREIKPYWGTRLMSVGLLRSETEANEQCTVVVFQNGYNKNAPKLRSWVRLRIGNGKPEWGAEPEKQYYILQILSCEVLNEDER